MSVDQVCTGVENLETFPVMVRWNVVSVDQVCTGVENLSGDLPYPPCPLCLSIRFVPASKTPVDADVPFIWPVSVDQVCTGVENMGVTTGRNTVVCVCRSGLYRRRKLPPFQLLSDIAFSNRFASI